MTHRPRARTPLTLFARVTLILVAGLAVAQVATLMIHASDRLPGALAGAGTQMPLIGGVFPPRFFIHLGLTLAVVVAVSLIAVRAVTRPLKDLATAATRFANDLSAQPLPEEGPAEVRRAAEAFNDMQGKLQQLVLERGRALAAVSHDLRTPLTRMRLRTELVDDLRLQAKLNEDIDTMRAMVDGVLSYLRGIENSEPIQTIDLEALLESVAEDERALGYDVSVMSECGTPAIAGPFRGRLTALRRAVTNLASNAAAHGKTVTLSLRAHPQGMAILVEDDGAGIPEADLVRVTEPFVRLDTARTVNGAGMGLGLAIVRDVAALHGGRLVLENRREGGLRASLILPGSR